MDKKLTANEKKSKYINPLVKVEQNTCIIVLLVTKPAFSNNYSIDGVYFLYGCVERFCEVGAFKN